MIENQGYYDVFVLTTWIGLGAAVLVCVEWYRESRWKASAGIVAPEAGEAVPAK
jgi:PAT family beta-lactamase induction signal transducer AmpG